MAWGKTTATPLAFQCGCGTIRGHLTAAGVASGTHVDCYCADCRANELLHQQPDPAPGPVDLFQMAPDAVRFEAGQDRLAVIRLGPKGMMRWYASCCGTPMFNTFASPALPFAGMLTARLADPAALGPVRAHGFVPQPGGKTRHIGGLTVVGGVLRRGIGARLSGRWRDTPFFAAGTGAPTAPVRILSKEERAALYPDRPATDKP